MVAVGKMPVRALFNVGDYESEYDSVPDNISIASWYPQPSVISQADAVIHHGGNNSFTECLYFGKPALIMPYVWDGHDNAKRIAETGHGCHMHRNNWTEEELSNCINQMLSDESMQSRLDETSRHMQSQNGPTKAASILNELLSWFHHAGSFMSIAIPFPEELHKWYQWLSGDYSDNQYLLTFKINIPILVYWEFWDNGLP